VVGGVDAELAEGLDDLRMRVSSRRTARRARLVAPAGVAAEQPLGDQRAAAIPDADEEDVQACSG
jgi:hypothetical protein